MRKLLVATAVLASTVALFCAPAQAYALEETDSAIVSSPLSTSYSQGWHSENGIWFYALADGSKATGWLRIKGVWYYFDPSTGNMLTGWVQVGDDWYYLKSSGAMGTGWLKTHNGWYHFASNGKMDRGWVRIGSSWYAFQENGVMATGWYNVDGKLYYLGEDGIMQKGLLSVGGSSYMTDSSGAVHLGWFTVDDRKYYADPETGKLAEGWFTFDSVQDMHFTQGKLDLGWTKIDGEWYYFGEDGVAVSGWAKISGSWYYLEDDYSMLTGWLQLGGTWYYLNKNGKMAVGFSDIDGKTYYFKASGAMATGWGKIDGSWYWFNANGSMYRGWKLIDGYWYYLQSDGKMAMGWLKINGIWYYFQNSSGHMARSTWGHLNGKWYYFASSGAMVTGWQSIKGTWYFFNNDGSMNDNTLSITLTEMVDYQFEGNSYIGSYTKQELRDILDPTKYSKSSVLYMMFADLTQVTNLTATQLNAYISGNSTGKTGMLKGLGAAFVKAANTYGINEAYLLAHAIWETGWGTSTLAQGYYYDGKTKIGGKYYSAGTYYNFFGVGAYDSSPLSGGRAMAIKKGWNSPEKAVLGGAEVIASWYIYGSSINGYDQKTIYSMKWDYLRSNEYKEYGYHQYATDPIWSNGLAELMYDIYDESDVTPSMDYIIPVYARE